MPLSLTSKIIWSMFLELLQNGNIKIRQFKNKVSSTFTVSILFSSCYVWLRMNICVIIVIEISDFVIKQEWAVDHMVKPQSGMPIFPAEVPGFESAPYSICLPKHTLWATGDGSNTLNLSPTWEARNEFWSHGFCWFHPKLLLQAFRKWPSTWKISLSKNK